MSTTAPDSTPADLEQQANATREKVDRTLDALQDRISIKRRVGAASAAISAAAGRASRMATPEITTLIRLDHTHVLSAFRHYRSHLSDARKAAIVANVCLGLEIHAHLEEEIFYPALLDQADRIAELDKSVTEHDEMRAFIQRLRQMSPRDPEYDETFYDLMRAVIHHVADEETRLLPLAETKLKDQLRELGWRMTRRRFELLKPHVTEVASTTVQTFPVLTGAIAVGLAAVVWLLLRPDERSLRH